MSEFISELVVKLNEIYGFDFYSIDYLEKLRQGLEEKGAKEEVYLILNRSYETEKEMHFLTFNNDDRNLVLKVGGKIEGYTPYAYFSTKLGGLSNLCRIY